MASGAGGAGRRGTRCVGDHRGIGREASDVVQEGREHELFVRTGRFREIGALEGVVELRDHFGPRLVHARGGAAERRDQLTAGQTRSNFWSDRISRGGVSRLPCAVHDTSATYRSPRESTVQPWGATNSRALAGEPAADARDDLALRRQDRHARAQERDVLVDGERGRQLADVEQAAVVADREEAARPVQVVALPRVAAPVVEDLDAMVLAVRDVDESLGIRRDVVRQVEAPRLRAGLAPREEVPARGSYLWTREFP